MPIAPILAFSSNHRIESATMRDHGTLSPLQTLFAAKQARALKITPHLARLYGKFHMPIPRSRQHVFANFVSTLDGVVSLQVPRHSGGSDISGFSAQDRMVMGLLRAIADVVVVGAGTLAADPNHLWTPDGICPELAVDYRALRAHLGKPATPLNAVVSGSGRLDLRLPVFSSGRVKALVITTTVGAKQLRQQKLPPSLKIQAIPRCRGAITARSILKAISDQNAGKLILIEGGPRLLGNFYAERLLDEQYLTVAPQVVGRDDGDGRLGFVMGTAFPPGRGRWGTLSEVRRGASQLFLRYNFRLNRLPRAY
jgi:riboflavin biosynthesis pyrimidine reductase